MVRVLIIAPPATVRLSGDFFWKKYKFAVNFRFFCTQSRFCSSSISHNNVFTGDNHRVLESLPNYLNSNYRLYSFTESCISNHTYFTHLFHDLISPGGGPGDRAQFRKNNTSVFVMKQITPFLHKPQLTIQTLTTSLQNKYSYLNAVKRSINTSSTPLIILINWSRLRLHS